MLSTVSQSGVTTHKPDTTRLNEPSTSVVGQPDPMLVLPSIDVGPRISIDGIQRAVTGESSASVVQHNEAPRSPAHSRCLTHVPLTANHIEVSTDLLDANATSEEITDHGENEINSPVVQLQAALPMARSSSSTGRSEKFRAAVNEAITPPQTTLPFTVVENTSSMFKNMFKNISSGRAILDDTEYPSTGSHTPEPVVTSSANGSSDDSSPSHDRSALDNASTIETPYGNPMTMSDLLQASTDIWKRNKRGIAREGKHSDHDRSGSGSTLINTPIRRHPIPTPFEVDFLTRCKAAPKNHVTLSPASVSNSSPHGSGADHEEPHRLGDEVTNSANKAIADVAAVGTVNKLSVAAQNHIADIKEQQRSGGTSMLTYIDKVKADYKDAEDVDWLVLRAWTELWHQAEVKELKAQLFVAEGTVESREVDIANNQEDFEAELQDVKEERDEALRAVKQHKRNFRIAEGQRIKCSNEARVAKEEKIRLERQVDDLKKALETEKETTEYVKDGLNQQLNEQTATNNNILAAAHRLQADFDLISNGNDMAAEIFRLRAETAMLSQDKQNLEQDISRLCDIEAENVFLKAENKDADLEVGFLHNKMFGYRWVLEDEDPARTAGIDGRLKRMDEERERLEAQVVEYHAALNAEKEGRAIDREHFMGQLKVEQTKVQFEKDKSTVVERSRDSCWEQKEGILEMLKGKVYKDDVVNTLTEDNEILRQDNNLLVAMIHDRESRTHDAKELEASLRIEIIKLTTAATTANEKVRQAEININGLELHNNRLELQEQVEESILKLSIDNKSLQISTEQQRNCIQELVDQGPDQYMREGLKAKDITIDHLNGEIARINGQNMQWKQHWIESHDGFCHVYDFDQVNDLPDWTAKDMQTRLNFAERATVQLRKIVEQNLGPRYLPWTQFQPLTEADGPYYREEASMVGQAF